MVAMVQPHQQHHTSSLLMMDKENNKSNQNAMSESSNEQIFTTLDGPKNRKVYAKALQTVIEDDSSPKVKFFALLNRKPYKPSEKVNEEEIVEMMKEHPDFCRDVYRFEAFHRDLIHPLHMLSALSVDVSTIRLCFKNCEAAMLYDESSLGSPIHYAVAFNANFELIRWLVKKDLDALELANNPDKHTPLHLACLYEADAETIFFLTDRFAQAAKLQDRDGNTPLHLVCSGEEPELEVVEDLTEVYPDAGLVKAENGKTPLMCAIGVAAETAVLRDLICSCPASAGIANRNGSTPLHLALRRGCDYTVIKDLVIAAKETCEIRDLKWGNLPVHSAVQSVCNNIEVYKLLARKYPDGLEVANKAGDTPHAMALKTKGLDAEIVDFLNPFEECSDEE